MISALALGLATGALGCRKSADEGPPVLGGTVVRELDDQQRMLRADFDDASARPRLLLLASPT
ncbi:MAG: hypothetical protein ABI193_03990 [Minicystis sp.]